MYDGKRWAGYVARVGDKKNICGVFVEKPYKICGLLGCHAASCGNCLPTFRDNVSVPSSWVKSPSRKESLSLTKIEEHRIKTA
jgi:hypothetical protein